MMWATFLVLLGQMTAAQPAQPGARPRGETPPPTTAPTTAPTYDHGPMRCEATALFDARTWFVDPTGQRPAEFLARWRIEGERLGDIARFGNIIFTEAVDDTGKSLLRPDSYTEEERTQMRPLKMAADQLAASGLNLQTRLDSPSRGAKTLKLRGAVRLVYAKGRQEITVDNPLQYIGKTIDNARLKELGIEVALVNAEELEMGEQPLAPLNQILALKHIKGQDRVQTVSLVDAWMRPVRTRERPVQTKSGDTVVAYATSGVELSEDIQLVLEVFATAEELPLSIEIDALPLP